MLEEMCAASLVLLLLHGPDPPHKAEFGPSVRHVVGQDYVVQPVWQLTLNGCFRQLDKAVVRPGSRSEGICINRRNCRPAYGEGGKS